MGIDAIRRDLKYSVRSLARTPGFSLLAVLTLALGIGANVAVFSIVYGILFRPLPYQNADRLVIIQREQTLEGAGRPAPLPFFNANDTDTWIQGLHSVDATALYSLQTDALSTESASEVIDTAVVSASFFPMLKGPFAAGRAFDGTEEDSPVVVVSQRLARALFASLDSAVGRQVTLSSRTYSVVGVADHGFQFPTRDTDVWMPARLARSLSGRCCGFRMLGRLTRGATIAAAATEASRLASAQDASGRIHASVVGLGDQMVSTVRPALVMLLAAVALVLLVSCTNVVNMLLTRQAGRDRDLATRWALGASRGQLIGHATMDAVVLGMASAIAGVLLARATLWLVVPFAPPDMPRMDAIHLDYPVLAFSVLIAMLASLAVAIPSALRSVPKPEALTASTGRATRARGRRFTQGLSVAQLAVSLVLLVSTSLLSRSFIRLLHTDIGVVTDRIATASLNFGYGSRPPDAQIRERVDRVIEHVRSIPGVTAVGVGTGLPPNAGRLRVTLRRAGDSVDYAASANAMTPGYFKALGLRLLAGRFFTEDDAHDRASVMIMSENTARRFFGEGDVVGRTMTLPVTRDGVNSSEGMTLVGIVSNVKYSGLAHDADDVVYRPFAQQTWTAPYLVVRTSGSADSLLPVLRRTIAAADRSIVLSEIRTLDSIISAEVAQPRFRTLWLGGMSGLAILVATIGLYGVVAHSVSQRTQEIGIRVALGASSSQITGMILREGLWLSASGIILGTATALAATRGLNQLLYGVGAADALSFGVSGMGLLVVSLLATYIPARKATRINPIATLRGE